MLKALTLTALLLTSFAAMAQTGTLQPVGCSDNRFCYTSLTTVDGTTEPLTLVASPSLVEVFLEDGSIYLGVLPTSLSITSFPVYRQPGNTDTLYVTAKWLTWTTKGSGSGRGGYASHTHWSLLSGSITR